MPMQKLIRCRKCGTVVGYGTYNVKDPKIVCLKCHYPKPMEK